MPGGHVTLFRLRRDAGAQGRVSVHGLVARCLLDVAHFLLERPRRMLLQFRRLLEERGRLDGRQKPLTVFPRPTDWAPR